MLNGLGPRYESFSTAMLKPPVPSYNDLIPLLHSHELRNKSLVSGQANPSLAFVGQHYSSQKRNFNLKGRGFNQASTRPPSQTRHFQPPMSSKPPSTASHSQPLQCQICKKKGHHALKCWHRFDNSYQDDQIP